MTTQLTRDTRREARRKGALAVDQRIRGGEYRVSWPWKTRRDHFGYQLRGPGEE
jgi:hypothetical protein